MTSLIISSGCKLILFRQKEKNYLSQFPRARLQNRPRLLSTNSLFFGGEGGRGLNLQKLDKIMRKKTRKISLNIHISLLENVHNINLDNLEVTDCAIFILWGKQYATFSFKNAFLKKNRILHYFLKLPWELRQMIFFLALPFPG